jgi:hypothetical protein
MAASSLIFYDIDNRKIIVFEDGTRCPHFAIHGVIRIQVLASFTFSGHFGRVLHMELAEILEAKQVDSEERCSLLTVQPDPEPCGYSLYRAVGDGRNVSLISENVKFKTREDVINPAQAAQVG